MSPKAANRPAPKTPKLISMAASAAEARAEVALPAVAPPEVAVPVEPPAADDAVEDAATAAAVREAALSIPHLSYKPVLHAVCARRLFGLAATQSE